MARTNSLNVRFTVLLDQASLTQSETQPDNNIRSRRPTSGKRSEIA